MRMSDSIQDLAAALAKAQAAIKGAAKDSTNPHFKSRYADLASVRDACFPALTAHGLSVVQGIGAQDGKVRVSTMLLHTSGQWIADDMLLTPRDESPQALGSCVTYGRRYALAAIAGVAPEEDDGEAAQGRGGPARETAAPIVVPPNYASWWDDLTATADTGMEALLSAWQQSPKAHQDYTRQHKSSALESLKAKARAADAARAAAAVAGKG